MNLPQESKRRWAWCKDALCLQKVIATLLVMSFSLGLVQSEMDTDGIPDATDPFPETNVQAPEIITPTEGEVLYTPSREVTFTGTAEVGSQIKLFEEGTATEISCQEPTASEVVGNGLLLSGSVSGSSVDERELLTNAFVVDQVFYNTSRDSVSTLWRTSPAASWAVETLDDAIDGICSYQATSNPDDRCGIADFPEQVIILLSADRLYIFDAKLRTFWKSVAVTNATAVVAENGKVFVGTTSGVQVLDFAGDDFTKTFVTELPNQNITSLDTVTIDETQYLLVGTQGGAAVVDLSTDTVMTALDAGILVGATFTTSHRVLWATATEAYISNQTVDLLADTWESTDITNAVRFPVDAPGTITVLESDLIGLTTGVSRVFDSSTGTPLIQNVSTSQATLPMGIATRGHWLTTDGSEAFDASPADTDLDNILSVSSDPVATGADTSTFGFGTADNYLQSKTTTDFSIAGSKLTVGAWVRRPDFGGVGPFKKILIHGDDNMVGTWDYFLSAGENFFGYGLNADPYYFGVSTTETERAASAFTFALDTWQLLVGTYDGDAGTLRMYLDGVEQDQNIFLPGINPVALTGSLATVDKDLYIGWGYDDEYFNGDVALPFVAEESYTDEQISLLHYYSQSWFAEDITTTLQGVSETVTDMACDEVYKECFVLTADGAVTRIDGNVFAGGVTSHVADLPDIAALTPTYLGTWQCTHAFDTSGDYAIFARTYWDGDPTAIDSELRNFTVYADNEQLLGTPIIVDFPENYVAKDSVRVLWHAEEGADDYFVAQIATDESFTTNLREQISQGHAARFDTLDDEVTYYFRVKAQNNTGGASDWSDVISITVDLSAPIPGVVTAVDGAVSSETEIAFEWGNVAFTDGGSGILWYEFELSIDQTFQDAGAQVYVNDRVPSTITNYEVIGEQGVTYYARVRAMDKVGNVSEWAMPETGTLIDTTEGDAFELLPLTATTDEELLLQWTRSADTETGIVQYTIWKKDNDGTWGVLDTVSPDRTTYNVTGLETGHTYTFKIEALNGGDLITETDDQEVNIQTSVLVAPQWLVSSYSNTENVSLRWTSDANVAEATHYQVFRNDTLLETVEISTTTLVDPNIYVSGDVITYKVRAIKEDDPDVLGAFSDELMMLVDTTAPTWDTYAITGTDAVNTWYNKPVLLELLATDGAPLFDPETSTGSGFVAGVDTITYREGTTDPFQVHNLPLLIDDAGIHNFQFQFNDRAGNSVVAPIEVEVKLDTIAPAVSLIQTTVTREVLQQKNGFIAVDNLDYEITATDIHSGVDTYELSYRLDKNGDGFSLTDRGDILWTDWAPVSATGTLPIPGDGILEVRVAVTDLAGNRTISDTITVKTDRDAPALSTDISPEPITANTTVQLKAIDLPVVLSGTETVYYTKDGSDPKTALYPTLHEGTTVSIDPATDTTDGYFIIKYYAVDKVGNETDVHMATNNPEDLDGDGLPDWWEALYGGDIDPSSDIDGDSLTASQEFLSHTDPRIAGTDGDSVSDGIEAITGTDPLNGTDHAFQWIAPDEGSVMKSTFTLLGTATPGVVAEIYNTDDSSLLGMGSVDPAGVFSYELSSLADGSYPLQVEFQHPDNPLAVIQSDIQTITIDDANAIQPRITNIIDNEQVGAEVSRVMVENVSSSATIELFEIINGVTYSITTAQSTNEGTADLWLPIRMAAPRYVFVLDQETWKTSEIVAFDQGVFLSGIVYSSNGHDEPLANATLKITDAVDGTIVVQTDSEGRYAVFTQPDTTYIITAEATGFTPGQQIITIAYNDVEVDLFLSAAGSAGTGTAGNMGWSGREIDNPADSIYDGWIPTMTYEESLEQVRRLNLGIAGQVKTVDIRGEERFAGYISGRIGVENFRAGDDKNILGITAFDGRGVDFLHASAPIGSCLQYRYTTMDFRDVSAKSSWYEAVSQIYSLGQMRLDEKFNFAPRDVLTWDSVLEMAFAVQCAEPDDFDLLRSFDLPSLKNYPLQNTLKSRRVYTAFDMGWLTSDVDIMQAPTREQVFRLWMKAFAIPVNKFATNTSFEDIESTDSLAPLLVAARKYDLIPATKRFRAESVMSRAEGAQWFVSFFNAEQEGHIDRSEELDQFEELREATGREVTEEEQVRLALIQKEIADERNERIAQIVPLPEDLDTVGKADFIRRQGEPEEDFLKRLEAAKQGLPEIVLPDYEELAEQSLIARGVVPREVSESMIQIEDRADFIRRQDEDREEFLQRLAAAKRELEQKKIALQPAVELTTMKASAPLQKEVQLQITQETDMSCRVKEEGETDAMFEARCLGVENKVEKTIYDKILEFFRKTPPQQEMEECEEVTISAPPEEPEMPQLDKTRLDVIFRIVTPEEEARNSTTKTKDK